MPKPKKSFKRIENIIRGSLLIHYREEKPTKSWIKQSNCRQNRGCTVAIRFGWSIVQIRSIITIGGGYWCYQQNPCKICDCDQQGTYKQCDSDWRGQRGPSIKCTDRQTALHLHIGIDRSTGAGLCVYIDMWPDEIMSRIAGILKFSKHHILMYFVVSFVKRNAKGKSVDSMLWTQKGLSTVLNNIPSSECGVLQCFSVFLY